MSNQLHQELKTAIDQCMIKDRFRFKKELHSRQGRQKLARRVEASAALAESRRQSLPNVEFPENLPVSGRVEDIKAALAKHQVVIVAGETGSGKTTQLPKVCLDMGRGVFGTIGHTQPRRVAARTVSHRIAEELGVNPGEQVGYQVRFTDQTRPETLVKVMTDGVLLAETQHDKFLEGYDTIIIDEAHERSLNIDFLLGYLKRILPRRPDLKVIVTSATIDVERFSRHFGNAPIIEVSGRTWPVEVHYRPVEAESKSDDADELMYTGVLDVLREIMHLERGRTRAGDVLVFLSGEREIRELAHQIRKSDIKGFEVLPLYSRLSVADQNKVFSPQGGRRIVLATNVAETSLTVPGIRYVIDPGLARISRYSVRSKVQQLPVEPISRASADQRKGRCGRISEGVCFRLYSEDDYLSRPEFTSPEIMRTNLASVILQMLTLHLGDMAKFPFVERPDQRQINDGFHLLRELQAVDDKRSVTRLGKNMARLPIDLRLARMLLEAGKNGCAREVLTIVSALAIQDPRERPHEHQQAADEKHRQHWDERSDFMAYVKLWDFYENNRQQLTQRKLRQFCHENFLSFIRMREWKDNHRQLHLVLKELGIRQNSTEADYESIHRALLSGLLGNIGEKTSENEYLGARNRRYFIFPGSSQFKRKPKWVVAAELVETSRLFGRTVAEVESEWIEPLATGLVKRNYHEPFFDIKRGQVFAHEEVMLYGVTIVKKRRVDFGSINPIRARQIFIEEGLVARRLNSKAGYFRHNEKLIEDVEALESKSRKRDLLVDEFALYRFYDERLPQDVCSEIELDAWRRIEERKRPKVLYIDKEYLMRHDAALSTTEYPDALEVGSTRLKLDYHFDPQHEDDGVSLTVPVALLRQVNEARLDWLIPGLLREKCLALLRSLPKSIRKNFVPAPEYVDRIIDRLEYDGRPLHVVMAETLFKVTGVRFDASAFDLGSLEHHLKMNIKVVDTNGAVLDRSRNLAQLLEKHAGDVEREFRKSTGHEIEVKGATDWTFGDVPQQVEVDQSGVLVRGYPALVDHDDSVALEVVDNQHRALELSRRGLARLLLLKLADQRKYLEKQFPRFREFSLFYATRGNRDELLTDVVEAVFRFTFVEDKPAVQSEADFNARVAEKQSLMLVANEVGDLLVAILSKANTIEQSLSKARTDLNGHACDDVRLQLDTLVPDRFITAMPLRWLRHLPRYLDGILYRLDKMRGNLSRDKENTALVRRLTDRYEALSPEARSSLEQYRWMLQEFRVSLFAQPLGTSIPVSAKRLEKEWQSAMASGERASLK